MKKFIDLVNKARKYIKYTFVLVAFIEAVDYFIVRVKVYTGEKGFEEFKASNLGGNSVDTSGGLSSGTMDKEKENGKV